MQVTSEGIVEVVAAELLRRGHCPTNGVATVDGFRTYFRVDPGLVIHVGPRAIHKSFHWSGTVANIVVVVDAILAVVGFEAKIRAGELRPADRIPELYRDLGLRPDGHISVQADGDSYALTVSGLCEPEARNLAAYAQHVIRTRNRRQVRRQRAR